MNFHLFVRIFKNTTDPISFCDCWTITNNELSAVAETSLNSLDNSDTLTEMHREAAWLMQALIEFMDLFQITHPGRGGLWQHSNYLYYEAIASLREATVAMLNGLPRASMGLLRSVFEMLMLHIWWQIKCNNERNTKKFYDWLQGQRNSPNMSDVIEDNLRNLDIPADEIDLESVKTTYKKLCSHVHAPIFRESITTLNGGNQSSVGIEIWQNFLSLARDTLRISIVHLIHLYPQCLFPVNVVSKFGFNPPAGLYFDQFNFVPFQAVFHEAQLETYRTHLQNHDLVQTGKQIYELRSDLTDEEIRQTWNNSYSKMENLEGAEIHELEYLYSQVKAQMRVAILAFSYNTVQKNMN